MNILFGFCIGESHYARRLELQGDEAMLSELGQRCAAYVRGAVEGVLGPGDAPRAFLNLLKPRRVPAERSFVLGIFPRTALNGGEPRLVGVLRFLHPDFDPATWYIPLLLLEPAARGQGLGSATHEAFARWSAARGARRLVVAVSEANGQALHFWRDRLGYTEAFSGWRQPGGAVCRRNHDLEHQVVPALAAASWEKMRV